MKKNQPRIITMKQVKRALQVYRQGQILARKHIPLACVRSGNSLQVLDDGLVELAILFNQDIKKHGDDYGIFIDGMFIFSHSFDASKLNEKNTHTSKRNHFRKRAVNMYKNAMMNADFDKEKALAQMRVDVENMGTYDRKHLQHYLTEEAIKKCKARISAERYDLSKLASMFQVYRETSEDHRHMTFQQFVKEQV